MKQLVLASGNLGKLTELQELFSPLNIQLIRQSDLGVSEAPEPYVTFVENALTKARNAAKTTGLPAISDDAGLCVNAFAGAPGVDTAYYAMRYGYPKSDANNVKVLLEQLKSHSDRSATMECVLVALRHAEDPQPLIAIGKVKVEIALQPVGEYGFGYDPVLFVPEVGQTFAQMTPQQKHQLSHRGQAARQMVQLIQQNWLG